MSGGVAGESGRPLPLCRFCAWQTDICTISPATAGASGGATLTIRGSGFQSATAVSISGKAATVPFKDMNTLTVVIPSLAAGSRQITVTNPDGEAVRSMQQ